MTLENLVPPIELCKRIPAGKFADSALVWNIRYGIPGDRTVNLIQRKDYHNGGFIVPAPTLQEIMLALPAYNEDEIRLCCISDFPEDGEKMVLGEAWSVGYTEAGKKTDKNPAIAALKIWLELEGGK